MGAGAGFRVRGWDDWGVGAAGPLGAAGRPVPSGGAQGRARPRRAPRGRAPKRTPSARGRGRGRAEPCAPGVFAPRAAGATHAPMRRAGARPCCPAPPRPAAAQASGPHCGPRAPKGRGRGEEGGGVRNGRACGLARGRQATRSRRGRGKGSWKRAAGKGGIRQALRLEGKIISSCWSGRIGARRRPPRGGPVTLCMRGAIAESAIGTGRVGSRRVAWRVGRTTGGKEREEVRMEVGGGAEGGPHRSNWRY